MVLLLSMRLQKTLHLYRGRKTEKPQKNCENFWDSATGGTFASESASMVRTECGKAAVLGYPRFARKSFLLAVEEGGGNGGDLRQLLWSRAVFTDGFKNLLL